MAKRTASFMDDWENAFSPKKNTFNRSLKDGTSIFGPKSFEGRPGSKHGHSGSNFYRSPHSSLGAAAIGRPHSAKGHKTHRW